VIDACRALGAVALFTGLASQHLKSGLVFGSQALRFRLALSTHFSAPRLQASILCLLGRRKDSSASRSHARLKVCAILQHVGQAILLSLGGEPRFAVLAQLLQAKLAHGLPMLLLLGSDGRLQLRTLRPAPCTLNVVKAHRQLVHLGAQLILALVHDPHLRTQEGARV
jgi:hypothetical protein